ncbi:MAG: TetR/AcrR family transcriptional regulator, partial [Alphaproteobacteria bacterium]|nr:TetR/AcrR family transcriptional regulator [Alphaproteobacteria bacterium]
GQTGIRDIAKHAGISLGNLYNHFKGKDALIAEIARLESVGLAEIVEKAGGVDGCFQALEIFSNALLKYSAGFYEGVLTIEITAMALRNPAIEGLFEDNRKMLIECLDDIFKRGQVQGKIARNLDRANTAEMVLDLIEGMGLRIGLSEKRPTRKQRAALHHLLRQAVSPPSTA